MEKAEPQPGVVCAKEALDLLNCVTESPYNQEKCLLFLNSLRNCVIHKKVKKFSLADQKEQKEDLTSNQG